MGGVLTFEADAVNPHIEDAIDSGSLDYTRTAHTDYFKEILEWTLSESIAEGFGVNFAGEKYIPADKNAKCSLITVKVESNCLRLSEDGYKQGRLRASVIDSSGNSYDNLSVTDRGFPNYNNENEDSRTLPEIQKSIQSQEEIYLRLGVSRQYRDRWRDGYWLQVNGIYMFPDLEKING